MLTNELKKGDRVQLWNGWYATIEDNQRGNTRMATVEGLYTETGSVYAWDIRRSATHDEDIELTPKQTVDKNMVDAVFGGL